MIWLLSARAFLKRIPWPVYAALGAVLAALAAWAWHNSQVTEAATEGRKAGATEQRETQLNTTIERAETANETREEIKSEVRAGNGDRLYNECLLASRAPDNCVRFLPRK